MLALPRRPPERALPLAAGTTAGSHQEVAGHRAPNQGGPAARAAGTGRIQNTHGNGQDFSFVARKLWTCLADDGGRKGEKEKRQLMVKKGAYSG